MQVKDYFNFAHLETLHSWLKQHKAYLPKAEEMPANGFVAYFNDKPVAMGFIRLVEGGYAQLDGLTSNPEAPGETRHQAIDAVVEALINEAKALGISAILAHTVDETILTRSKKHGFVQQPHTVIALSLK